MRIINDWASSNSRLFTNCFLNFIRNFLIGLYNFTEKMLFCSENIKPFIPGSKFVMVWDLF
jgi:hypothetical protein